MVTERQDREKQQAIVRPKPKELEGYVGFANLPNQVYRKAVKRGFEFTLMVVGKLSHSAIYFNAFSVRIMISQVGIIQNNVLKVFMT